MVLAFISIEKTAGQSTNFILRNSFGLNHCDAISTNGGNFTNKEFAFTKSIYPNLKSIAGHRIVPFNNLAKEKNKKEIFYFTFLRNPSTRCASHYQFVKQVFPNITPNFEQWISIKENQNLQCRKLSGLPSFEEAKKVIDEKLSFVGLLEKYNCSMNYLAKISPQNLNLYTKEKNVAQDNSIKEEIFSNPHMNNLLENANIEDLKLYNYVKNIYYPLQIENIDNANKTNLVFVRKSRIKNYKSIFFRNVIYKPIIALRYILQNRKFRLDFEQMEGVNFSSMSWYYKFDYFKRKITHKFLNIK